MSEQHDHSHHIVPLRTYYLTLAGLLVLTAITVGASYIHFGSTAANWAVSMAIASMKASLVLMFFMGLKWDSMTNKMTMVGSVAGLATFIFFVSADLAYREERLAGTNFTPVKEVASGVSMAEMEEWQNSSPELIAQGQKLYSGMGGCATCHGEKGLGDGIAGAALNPKPRNFAATPSTWTNGTSVKSIYVTLTVGVKGTGMAGYQAMLSPKDRLALTHYVRSLNASPADSGKVDDQFATLIKEKDGVGGAGGGNKGIPVDFAIEQMLKAK